MKKICISICMMFLGFCVLAQDGQAVREVLNTQRQAWNKGDLKGFMQTYWKSDSLLFVGKNGPTYGWQNTLDNYVKGYPDKAAMGILSFDIKEVRLINSDHAFVLGGWHLKRTKDEPQGYFTLVLKKMNGEWKIIADHSS